MKRTMLLMFTFCLISLNAIAAPVPETGVTKCYDNSEEITCPSPGQPFYGQDANYRINPMSYTKLDANGNALPDSATSWTMAKDNVTSLIWEMKTNKDGVLNYNDPHDADNTYIWLNDGKTANDIKYFIKILNDDNYGGYSDWRLPTIHELSNIIDYSIPSPGPTISIEYFPNTVSSIYWSSTLFSLSEGAAHWGVNFYYGYISNDNYWSTKGYVRAVRGGLNNSYKDNRDGTVTDNSTGLMWQQASTSDMTWEQSLAYCESLKLGGYSDWRLPTLKELRSLVNYNNTCFWCGPAIDNTFFPNTASSFYWSSTTVAYDIISSWGVDFVYGEDNYNGKSGSSYVRAVRGGLGKCKPMIKANGTQHEITVKSGNNLIVSASLEAGDKTGISADWWFAIETSWGWFFQTTSGLTQSPMPLYKSSPLYDFYDHDTIEGILPAGVYKFYFAVYITSNDSTESPLYIDSVTVQVVN